MAAKGRICFSCHTIVAILISLLHVSFAFLLSAGSSELEHSTCTRLAKAWRGIEFPANISNGECDPSKYEGIDADCCATIILSAEDFWFHDAACLFFYRYKLSHDDNDSPLPKVHFYLSRNGQKSDWELAGRNDTMQEKLCLHVNNSIGLTICVHMHELTYILRSTPGKVDRYEVELGVSAVLEITSECPSLPLLGSYSFKRFDLLRHLIEI